MSEVKIKELQEFVDNFHKKLKESFKIYEYRNKKERYLKKNFSQVNNEIKIKNKFPTLSIKNEEDKNIYKSNELINKSMIWKPPRGTPDYFEEFKCLINKHELNNWEKVSKYLFYLY